MIKHLATAAPVTDSAQPLAGPVVVTASWPWRGSEKRIIALLPFLGLAIGFWGQGWWWTAAAVGLGASVWLYQVGTSRKRRSQVTATVTSYRIALRSGGALGSSAVAIGDVDEISYGDFQSDRALILVGGGSAARVPERLLDQEPVRRVVTRVLAGQPRVSAQAQVLLTDLGLA